MVRITVRYAIQLTIEQALTADIQPCQPSQRLMPEEHQDKQHASHSGSHLKSKEQEVCGLGSWLDQAMSMPEY